MWYLIIGLIVCLVTLVVGAPLSKNFENVVAPALILGVVWPLVAVAGLVFLVLVAAAAPLYALYLISRFLVEKYLVDKERN